MMFSQATECSSCQSKEEPPAASLGSPAKSTRAAARSARAAHSSGRNGRVLAARPASSAADGKLGKLSVMGTCLGHGDLADAAEGSSPLSAPSQPLHLHIVAVMTATSSHRCGQAWRLSDSRGRGHWQNELWLGSRSEILSAA